LHAARLAASAFAKEVSADEAKFAAMASLGFAHTMTVDSSKDAMMHTDARLKTAPFLPGDAQLHAAATTSKENSPSGLSALDTARAGVVAIGGDQPPSTIAKGMESEVAESHTPAPQRLNLLSTGASNGHLIHESASATGRLDLARADSRAHTPRERDGTSAHRSTRTTASAGSRTHSSHDVPPTPTTPGTPAQPVTRHFVTQSPALKRGGFSPSGGWDVNLHDADGDPSPSPSPSPSLHPLPPLGADIFFLKVLFFLRHPEDMLMLRCTITASFLF